MMTLEIYPEEILPFAIKAHGFADMKTLLIFAAVFSVLSMT
jgi:hypothetical protein